MVNRMANAEAQLAADHVEMGPWLILDEIEDTSPNPLVKNVAFPELGKQGEKKETDHSDFEWFKEQK
jgi:hypothetical protein